MRARTILSAALAVAGAGTLLVPGESAHADHCPPCDWLSLQQRDVFVFNNFTDAAANDNGVPQAQFPGQVGAVLAIWKGVAEWGSGLHGDGDGDPHQPFGLGSGGANFDQSFQGQAFSVGSSNSNTHSEIQGSFGGVFAFTETPVSDGWRVRYVSSPWNWQDGPGVLVVGANGVDLQGLAAHEAGHALGLGHSSVPGATMVAATPPGNPTVELRSIEDDDRVALQSIYGVKSASKPILTSVSVAGGLVTLQGANFDLSDNEVWFTGVKLSGVVSDGATITLALPLGAQPGDVLVRIPGTQGSKLSNAFPFDPAPDACPAPVPYCASNPNSTGQPAVLGWFGSASIVAADLSLIAAACPLDQIGLFFYGDAQAQLPFGNGVLCIGSAAAGVFRLPAVGTGPVGNAVHLLDYDDPPAPAGQISAGSTWNFQYWFRDPPGGGAGFNLTDALQITFCP